MQVGLHALNLRVADVASVQKRQQVENGEHGNQAQVHLPQNLFAIHRRGVNPFSCPIWVMVLGCLEERVRSG